MQDGVLRAEFNTHIANRHALGNAHIRYALSVEFNAHVVGPVGLYVADELKDEVLRRYAGLEFAGDDDLHALRHLEPDFAGSPYRRHLAASDTCAKCSVSTVGTGVAVAADHHEARKRVALFTYFLVTDAAAAHYVVEVRNALFGGKLAHFLVVYGVRT